MKLKLDENGAVVTQDGKPVYVHDDGKEIAFDAPAAMAKIKELNGESAKHRIEAKEAMEKLSIFADLDPEAARKALATVKNLDDKKLVDAGEVEALKKQLGEIYEGEKAKLNDALKKKDSQIYRLMISNRFAESKFLSDKTVLPHDVAAEYFGKNFKIEEGDDGVLNVVGHLNGEKIYSRVNPGEVAGFEEALSTIVDNYQFKDHILKTSNNGGSGGGSGGTGGNIKPDLSKLSPVERLNYARQQQASVKT